MFVKLHHSLQCGQHCPTCLLPRTRNMLFAYALLPFFTPYVAAPRAKHVNATPEYRGVNVIALFTNWHACIMLATCRNKRLFFTLSLHLFKSRLLVDIGHVVLLLSHFECMLAVESYVLCKIKQPNFKAGKISGEKLPHVIIEMSLHLFLLNEKAGPRKQHTHIPSHIILLWKACRSQSYSIVAKAHILACKNLILPLLIRNFKVKSSKGSLSLSERAI